MPFTLQSRRMAGNAALLSLCLLSSCASRIVTTPVIPSAGEDAHVDPARDASVRLLQEAYRAYVQERYPTAARFFRRFLDDVPDAPRSPEARWWLGRSLEQVGNLREAAEQYRLLASAQPTDVAHVYGAHATRRLGELGRQRAGDVAGDLRLMALRVGAGRLPQPLMRPEWLQALAQAGVTALLFESTSVAGDDSMGGRSEEWIGLVAEAHRLGLQVWLALDVHQAKGFQLKAEWASLRETTGSTEASTGRPDVVHPDYQAYVEELVKALAIGGCDGLLLHAREASAFSSEYSDGSFRAFAESFGSPLTPLEVLRPQQSADSMAEDRAVAYWRWVGWKAWRYARLVERVRRVLRQTNPLAVVMVEVHGLTVEAPVQAIEQYGEDVAELVRAGSVLLVRQEGSREDVLLGRLSQQVRNPDQLWVNRSIQAPAGPPSPEGLRRLLENVRESARWNLLVDGELLPSIP